MTTIQRIKHAHCENLTAAVCPSLRRVDRARSIREYTTGDFEHIPTLQLGEDKKGKGTVNQIHPTKADFLIVHKSDNEHIVVTMEEVFPLLTRQHTVHPWGCASVTSKKLCKEYGPWLSTEHLNDAVEAAAYRALNATAFKARQAKARDELFAHKDRLNAI